MKFSVLTSIYQKEKPEYLKECLKSIIHQTLLPDEIVIVKDGPLTESLEAALIESIQHLKMPIKIISLEINQGLGIALQEGLKACTYDYIARMDTDDLCHPQRFERQIRVFKKNPTIDVLGSWISEFNTTIEDLKAIRRVPGSNAEIYAYAKFRNPINHMTVMFKKSKALEAGGYQPFQFMEDYYLWIRMMLKNNVFCNIQQPLVYARIGNNMLLRRIGWTYFLMEKKFFGLLKRHQFISLAEYLYILTVRFVVRTAPRFIIKLMYGSVLRS